MAEALDFTVMNLGECAISSPMSGVRFVKEDDRILYHSHIRGIRQYIAHGKEPPHFEEAGPREKIFFDPANPACAIVTSALCLLFGQNAVHAGMAGRTGIIIGFWNQRFTHVPISLAVSERKKIDPEGWIWSSLLSSSGQPRDMR